MASTDSRCTSGDRGQRDRRLDGRSTIGYNIQKTASGEVSLDEKSGSCEHNSPTPPICAVWTSRTEQFIHRDIPRVVIAVSLVAVRRPRSCVAFIILVALSLLIVGFSTNFTLSIEEFEMFAPFGVRPASHKQWLDNEAGFPKEPLPFVMMIHRDGNNILGREETTKRNMFAGAVDTGLGQEGMRRAFQALDTIRNVPGYNELCSKSTHVDITTNQRTCLITSPTRFWDHNLADFEEATSSDQDVKETLSREEYPNGVPVDTDGIMGHPKRDENGVINQALSFSVIILLPDVEGVEEFEMSALDHILPVRDTWTAETGNTWRLEAFSQRSYADEFQRAIVKDLPLVPLVFVVMASFTCLVFYRRHKVESRVLLGLGSVLTIAMSLMSGYGLMFILGVPFTNMTQLVPFVVFGVGLDDTFIIVGAFLRTDRKKDIEERVIDALQEVGLSISVTTITTAFAFGLGSISSIPAVRWLCFYSMSTIVIDFIYQITFFVALLVLDERRIQASRDAVLVCCTVDRSRGEVSVIEARDQPGSNFIDRFMEWFGSQIVRPAVRFCVVVSFMGLLAGCAYSSSKLRQEFNIDELVPDGSYVIGFFDSFQDYSTRSLPVYAYFRDVDQSDSGVHDQMKNYMDELAELDQFGDEIPYCWVTDFKRFLEDDRAALLRNLTFYEQVSALLNFPAINEVYGENIVFSDDGEIVASRCVMYAESLDVNVVAEQVDLLHDQRNVTASQPINENRDDWAFFTFDRFYLTWEFYDAIVGEWIFTTIAGVTAVTVIGFICMPHWTAVLFIFPLIAILYIDLIGTIQFSGLYINVVTHVSLAMSIGLLVDYIMHVLLGYYEAPGKSRSAKVQYTLRTVGSPVLVGGLSTFLGVLPLAFSSSAVMRTVFECFVSMVSLGCGHGIIFLPVVLSMCGPTTRCSLSGGHAVVVARKSPPEKERIIASHGEVLLYLWGCGIQTRALLVVGCVAGVLSGVIYPAMAFLFASALSSLSAAATDLDQIREVSFLFILLGLYGLLFGFLQTACFEIVAARASKKLRLQWFEALLRQDAAFFDVVDVSSFASTIESSATAFQLGIGKKMGEAVEFGTAFIGGFAFAFYSSWRLALVIIGILPLSLAAAYVVVNITQNKKSKAQSAYANAAAVSASTIRDIRTVLSLNGIKDMAGLYSKATREAFQQCISGLWKEGLATGCMVAAFMLIHCALTLYGGYLVYSDIMETGCDPSGGVEGNEICDENGPSVFGATLGVIFASLGIPAISNFIEAFTASRVALRRALKVIECKVGCPREEIFRNVHGNSVKLGVGDEAVLPPYVIDPSYEGGLKLDNIDGTITFKDVKFCYPSRPTSPVLSGLDLKVKAGTTVALVGRSGSGKSSIVALVERFYDPTRGRVELDGIDLKELNVKFLRSIVSYVGQEPVIFAATIAENILSGMPGATQNEIEDAAKLANAHDFIMSFPKGYDTWCGDNGTQLSEGQRQRLAIARAFVGNPRILLLDEATSALDSESEIIVQTALSNFASRSNMTTIVVAHRLSTIRNADSIAVIGDGRVLEQGNHRELMRSRAGYYRSLVKKNEGGELRSLTERFPTSLSSVGSGRPGPVDAPSSLEHDHGVSNSVGASKRAHPIDPPTSRQHLQDKFQLNYQQVTVSSANCSERTMAGAVDAANSFYLSLINPEGGVPNVAVLSQEPKPLSLSALETFGSSIGPNAEARKSPIAVDRLSAGGLIATKNEPIFAFEDVEFSYPVRPGKIVLNKLCIKVKRGETVALLGPSGGGKSTVLSLIQRFYDPDEGCVKFLGNDVKNLDVSWYRNQIGYIGQEPILFNTTIAANIAFGVSNVLQEDIENAARAAHAHDFITSELPDGYETVVGERGSQLSGGQRQRIALARAWMRKPRVLLLDEATSALDSESELAVQQALKILMEQEDLTVIIVAHRLSTVQKADRFIHIQDGKAEPVAENSSLEKYYRHLLEYRSGSTQEIVFGSDQVRSEPCPEEEEIDDRVDGDDSSMLQKMEEVNSWAAVKRLFRMSEPDRLYLVVGIFGSLMVGSVFPVWGILLAEAIGLLFQRVEECTGDFCQDEWDLVAHDMQQRSFKIGAFWSMLFVVTVAGFVLLFVGFGIATERLTNRVRDSSFSALTRQEVGFFDKQSVGSLTSQLENDAARLYAFTGDPLRGLLVCLSSIVAGIVISFVYMWPFALMTLLTIPLLGFAVQHDQQVSSGRNEGTAGVDALGSRRATAIVVDSVLNMRTVAALTLERQRFEDYDRALSATMPTSIYSGLKAGAIGGLIKFIQQGVTALQAFWGGWLIFNHSGKFGYDDFLVSLLSLQFSTFGLSLAFQDLSDRKETAMSAARIFYLLDRKSRIDPSTS